VAEGWFTPYGPENPHVLFSLTKSFTSTAVGLAVAENKLSIDDTVLSFFPDDAPKGPSKNLSAMRVRHLLTMTTGHAEDATERTVSRGDGNWVKGFFSVPVKHEPGTHFVYNSAASHMLSAIVQKVVGMPILEYLMPRLFEPLGIEGMSWENDPRGINTGGWGLSIKTEDIARFGQMYLQKGVWNGTRILSEEWVEMATSKQVSNDENPPADWHQGYGFQFWRCQNNAFRGDGAFGQYCIVMPEQDAVLAMTSAVKDMQSVLDLVWKHILPAFGPEALPADDSAHQRLLKKETRLQLHAPKGKSTAQAARLVSGKVYTFEENPLGWKSISVAFAGRTTTLTMRDSLGKHALVCGTDGWVLGKTTALRENLHPVHHAPVHPPRPVAASCTWTDEDTLLITARFYETPFYYSLTCKFNGDEITVTSAVNVSFAQAEPPQIIGRVAPRQ
jgi:CubicO group peptidase (beta-lactamase class C family)